MRAISEETLGKLVCSWWGGVLVSKCLKTESMPASDWLQSSSPVVRNRGSTGILVEPGTEDATPLSTRKSTRTFLTGSTVKDKRRRKYEKCPHWSAFYYYQGEDPEFSEWESPESATLEKGAKKDTCTPKDDFLQNFSYQIFPKLLTKRRARIPCVTP